MQPNKENKKVRKTPLYDNHIKFGAKMVDFSDWMMPLNYREGITAEHLATRKRAGLFDVSHMGRFTVSGKDCLTYLQHVLTSNAASLEVGESQYTIISDEEAVAVDDAYLYRFTKDEYLLVLNSSNLSKDFSYLQDIASLFNDINIIDRSKEISMLSLQGPQSKNILLSLISSGHMPKLARNKLAIVNILGGRVLLARTGYTGEQIGYELFVENNHLLKFWESLVEKGANPVGLGARDSLRLEAKLPLYGHELGKDFNGNNIAIFSSLGSRIAVDFSQGKGEFVGKKNLEKQYRALNKILKDDYSNVEDLPKIIVALELMEKGIARYKDKVFLGDDEVGYVTSGTIVPYWNTEVTDDQIELTDKFSLRSIAMALVDSDKCGHNIFKIEIRQKKIKAFAMPYFFKKMDPFLYPVTFKNFYHE